MKTQIVVIDYGMGNLLSVRRALEHCGAEVLLSDSVSEIASADRIVLPGVGAFGDGMEELRRRGLIAPLRDFVHSGRPFLGICLGMQMMMDSSEEFGIFEGLKLIPGPVRSIRSLGDPLPRKVPHIGWNKLMPASKKAWKNTLLEGIAPESDVYFIHSFTPVPANPGHWLAYTTYEGHRLSAVIQNDAAYGCQFHPEKSGPVGLAILNNFLKLKRSSPEASRAQ